MAQDARAKLWRNHRVGYSGRYGDAPTVHDVPTLAPRNHQALPGGGRQRRHLARGRAGRDPRRARREWRRQVHADEGDLRGGAPRRGRDAVGRKARARAQSARSARARHRDGVPALLALRHAHRRGERVARAGRFEHPRRGHRAHSRCRQRVRARRRSAASRAHAVGGRTPARRDRPRSARRPAALDPRRAHLGPHAAGRAEALRDAAPARRGRLLHPLHQPQARRDPDSLPSLHRPSRRSGDRRGRSARGDERHPLAPHDRRRSASPLARAAEARGRGAEGARPASAQGRSRRRDARGRRARRAGRGDRRHRRGLGQRPAGAHGGALGRRHPRRGRQHRALRRRHGEGLPTRSKAQRDALRPRGAARSRRGSHALAGAEHVAHPYGRRRAARAPAPVGGRRGSPGISSGGFV